MNAVSHIQEEHIKRVLNSFSHIENPRTKQILLSLIQHLYNFAQEVNISNKEWEFAWKFMGKMAKFTYDTKQEFTHEYRNEFLLFADLIGLSDLIEMINNPAGSDITATGTSLLGPFYLAGAPFRERGTSTIVEGTPGERCLLKGKVTDPNGNPLEGAILDIWQCDTRGLYETQDPTMPKMNLRGKYTTDKEGTFELICLYPTGYPVPSDGPCGELLKTAKRPNLRPAHLHFIVSCPNYITLVTQLCAKDDPAVEDDATFSARENTIVEFLKDKDHYYLEQNFKLYPGTSQYPKSPLNEVND